MQTKEPCETCNGPIPGVFIADPTKLLGLPGWVQACGECDVYKDDLEALNAVMKYLGRPPLNGYPFSMVSAEWNTNVEQRFIVSLTASITLRCEDGYSFLNFEELANALADGFLDWQAQADCGLVEGLVQHLEIEQVYPIGEEEADWAIGKNRP